MSSFKMPAHPIYLNGYVDSFRYLIGVDVSERKRLLNEVFNDNVLRAEHNKELVEARGEAFMRMRFYSEIEQKLEIIDNGHQLVKISSDDWNESVSKKTLGKVMGAEVMLPYEAFAIDIKGAEWAWNYHTAFVSKYKDQLVIRLEDDKDNWYLILLALGKTIEDTIAETVSLPHSEDITYKILSIIMYMTLFKREPNRVNIKTVKARNTQGVPKHRVSQIRLIQPEYSLIGKAKGKRGEGIQLHLRRGFWKSQPYGKREEGKRKTIFVKATWVGQGREVMMRETVI